MDVPVAKNVTNKIIRLIHTNQADEVTLPARAETDSGMEADSHAGHCSRTADTFRQWAFGHDSDLAAVFRSEDIDRFPAFHAPFIQRGLNEFIFGSEDAPDRLDTIFP